MLTTDDLLKLNGIDPNDCGYQMNAVREFKALKHGLCSRILVLPNESKEELDQLLARWSRDYNHPDEDSPLGDFLLKTVQAEWERIRAQRQFDLHVARQEETAMLIWAEDTLTMYDRLLRYRTAAERKFQREFRMLDSNYKAKLAKEERAEKRREAEEKKHVADEEAAVEAEFQADLAEAGKTMWVINAETGEGSTIDGKQHRGPVPGWVPQKIVPGEYGPNDPRNFDETFRREWFERRRLRQAMPDGAATDERSAT